jgi:hypothetical protein
MTAPLQARFRQLDGRLWTAIVPRANSATPAQKNKLTKSVHPCTSRCDQENSARKTERKLWQNKGNPGFPAENLDLLFRL